MQRYEAQVKKHFYATTNQWLTLSSNVLLFEEGCGNRRTLLCRDVNFCLQAVHLSLIPTVYVRSADGEDMFM